PRRAPTPARARRGGRSTAARPRTPSQGCNALRRSLSGSSRLRSFSPSLLYRLSPNRVEEVDEIAVRITEEHRPVSPRLVRRFEDELPHDRRDASPFPVDVVDAKIDDGGAIRGRGRRARTPRVQLALRADGEDATARSQLGVLAGIEPRDGEAGD